MFIFLRQNAVSIAVSFYILKHRIRFANFLLTYARCRLPHTDSKMAAMLSLRNYHQATQTAQDCRLWMRANGLLARHMMCHRCGSPMEERPYARVQDGVVWRCLPRQCRATASIRKGSFFEASHLSLQKLMDLAYFWTMDVPNAEVQYQVIIFPCMGSTALHTDILYF